MRRPSPISKKAPAWAAGIRAKVSAGVEEKGEIVLNARLFGDIIRRMPDDTVTFISNEKLQVHGILKQSFLTAEFHKGTSFAPEGSF